MGAEFRVGKKMRADWVSSVCREEYVRNLRDASRTKYWLKLNHFRIRNHESEVI